MSVYRINLPENCHVDWCHEELKNIIPKLENAEAVEINVTDVERIGTPAVQLLLSVDKFCREFNKSIIVKGQSENFYQIFKTLGFEKNYTEWGGISL